MNVTKWSADALLYQLAPLLKSMDHERNMNWLQEERFIRNALNGATFDANEGLFCNRSVGLLWQRLRPIRRLANGKSSPKILFPKKLTI